MLVVIISPTSRRTCSRNGAMTSVPKMVSAAWAGPVKASGGGGV